MYMNGADVCMSIVSPVIAIDKCRYYYFVFIYIVKSMCISYGVEEFSNGTTARSHLCIQYIRKEM